MKMRPSVARGKSAGKGREYGLNRAMENVKNETAQNAIQNALQRTPGDRRPNNAAEAAGMSKPKQEWGKFARSYPDKSPTGKKRRSLANKDRGLVSI